MTHAWILWLVAIAAFDFDRRRVPNWLSLAGALGAVAALLSGSQPFGIGWAGALGGAAAQLLLLLLGASSSKSVLSQIEIPTIDSVPPTWFTGVLRPSQKKFYSNHHIKFLDTYIEH